MNDFELIPQDYIFYEEGKYSFHANEIKVGKFSCKVILVLFCTALSSIILPEVNDFTLDKSFESTEYFESKSFISYLESRPNRDSVENQLSKIKSYPEDWWSKYDADKPESNVFDNVKNILDFNSNDKLLEDVEVLPKRNATILLEWDNASFMCSLNIGEKEFSYSILPNNSNPLTGLHSIDDREEIAIFYHRLESFINV